MLGVGCTGVNQCGPLQASTLTLKPSTHRASASVLTPGQCLRLDMTLMLGVGCTGVIRCGPLQASTLTLVMVRPLLH